MCHRLFLIFPYICIYPVHFKLDEIDLIKKKKNQKSYIKWTVLQWALCYWAKHLLRSIAWVIILFCLQFPDFQTMCFYPCWTDIYSIKICTYITFPIFCNTMKNAVLFSCIVSLMTSQCLIRNDHSVEFFFSCRSQTAYFLITCSWYQMPLKSTTHQS